MKRLTPSSELRKSVKPSFNSTRTTGEVAGAASSDLEVSPELADCRTPPDIDASDDSSDTPSPLSVTGGRGYPASVAGQWYVCSSSHRLAASQ